MVVKFNTGDANFVPVRQNTVRRADSSSADGLAVSFSSQTLQETLKQSAQVRPEKVAEATALASDPNYPSDQQLNRLAGHLANRL